MGEGSYGQVFEGMLRAADGEQRVVLKRVKKRVQGAEEMGQMEHVLNVYVAKAAAGSVAEFMGYIEVGEHEATSRLSPGLWLMWKYEGRSTLDHFLRRRDCVPALADALGIEQAAVVPTVMKQVLEGIAALHAAGLVHRDIKPLNIIFSGAERRFKLIDLGAAADLRTGTNYVPDESILDPAYCPPEQYCMPTDAPHLARQAAPIAQLMSPVLWLANKPDRFDSYSAGLVLMQLALPKLRTPAALKAFNKELADADFDLDLWRRRQALPARQTAILDADGHSGWELARALLRPRRIVADRTGRVAFKSGGAQRIAAAAALRHTFIRNGAQETAAPQEHTRPRRGLLASLTATFSEMSSDDDASSSQRRSGSTAGGTHIGQTMSGSFGQMLGSFWVSARRGSQGVLAQPQTFPRAGSGSASARGSTSGRASGEDSRHALRGGSGAARDQHSAPKLGAASEALAPEKTRGVAGIALGLWRSASNQLLNLEAKIMTQTSATQVQAMKVRQLEDDVAEGRGDADDLTRARGLLTKMTRRLNVLTSDFQTAAVQASSTLGDVLGRRGTSSTTQEEPPPSPATSATPSGGGGGGLSRLTGSGWMSRLTAQQSQPAPPAPTSGGGSTGSRQASPQLAAGQRIQWSRRPAAPEEQQPGPELQASKAIRQSSSGSGSGSVSTAANSAIYAGLKFTGLALTVAADLAKSVRKDLITAQEAKGATTRPERPKQQQRENPEQAKDFMQLLKELRDPPITAKSRWSKVREQCRGEPRYEAIGSVRAKERLFRTYQDTLAQLEALTRQRLERAQAGFKALLAEAKICAESDWDAVRAHIEDDARYAALKTDGERRRIFESIVSDMRQQAASLQSAREAELAFKQLLTEADPVINGGSTWPAVKRVIWSDPRYEELSERERRRLFGEYRDVLRAAEREEALLQEQRELAAAQALAATREAQRQARAEEADSRTEEEEAAIKAAQQAAAERAAELKRRRAEAQAAEPEFPAVAPRGGDLLAGIRDEQAAMKQEYRRMEAKLREMEEKLRLKEMVLSSIEEPTDDEPAPLDSMSDEEPNGSITFRFPAASATNFRSLNGTQPK